LAQGASTETHAGLILAMPENQMLQQIKGRARLGLALAFLTAPQGPFGVASATSIARNRGGASDIMKEPTTHLSATSKEGAALRPAGSTVAVGAKNTASPRHAPWASSLLAWKAELAEDVFGLRNSESASTPLASAPVAPSLLEWKDELGEDVFGRKVSRKASLDPVLLEWKAELVDDLFGSSGKEVKTKLTIFQQLANQTKMGAGDIFLVVVLVVVLVGVMYLLFTGNVAEPKKNEPGILQHGLTQIWQDATGPSQPLFAGRSPNPYAMGSWAQHEFSQQQGSASTVDPYPRSAREAAPGRFRSQKSCC